MSDGSRGTNMVTAGLEFGDKYSYLCLIDTESGKVVEERRLRTTPECALLCGLGSKGEL